MSAPLSDEQGLAGIERLVEAFTAPIRDVGVLLAKEIDALSSVLAGVRDDLARLHDRVDALEREGRS